MMYKIEPQRDIMRKPAGTGTHRTFMTLVSSIVSGNTANVLEIIDASPDLVRQPSLAGASREAASQFFFPEIRHYLYAGDTALHMAGAAFKFEIAQILIDRGANCAAKNRRGAEPLHYASDCNTWNPTAQAATIECLIRAGANPNATDKSGVAPIHRAVRTRCAAAVQTLLSGGAKPHFRNKSGSTPLHLAVQHTGRSGSGTDEALEQQRQIILILLQNGANPKDRDGRGKTVHQVVTVGWIRELLDSVR
jgi:Ankyrin repeats (3 copies)/Ankyrin repeat